MYKIVLLRHGESVWNKENLFSGWTDIDLSEQGLAEAHRAGQLLKSEGFVFDVAFTSVLKRAIRTLWITLDELDQMWIPVHHSWRLNERHYGAAASGDVGISLIREIIVLIGPILMFPVWGVALAVAMLGYYYRRRGPCSVCGRGASGESGEALLQGSKDDNQMKT